MHLKAAAAPVLRVRKTVAWLSLLVVPAGWLLARRFMSDRWALLAALLAGTSLLAIHFGTQARPHGAAAAWPGLTVVACMQLARSPTIKNYLLVTLMGGLAIGSLQSGVGLGFPVLLAHVLKNRGWRRHLRLLIPLTGLVLAFALFYPFLFDGVTLTKTGDTLELGGHEMYLSQFNGGGIPIILRTLIGWEPALTVGVLLALLVTLRNRMSLGLAAGTRIERRITLAYVLPYLLVIALNPRTGERFILPLIPFLAAWTAWGLSRLHTQGARRLALTLAALLALFPTLVGIKLCALRHRPSTLDHAAQWLATHVADKDDPIYIFRPNVLPLFKTDESTAADEADHPLAHRRQLNWSSYQRDQLQGRPQEQAWNLRFSPIEKDQLVKMRTDPARYLKDLTSSRLFILEVYEDHRVLHAFNNLTEAIRSLYPKLTEFKPGPPHEVPLAYQDLTREQDLAILLERRAVHLDDVTGATDMLWQAAELYSQWDEPEAEIRVLGKALDLERGGVKFRERLKKLLEEQERWAELILTLEQEAEDLPEGDSGKSQRADLQYRVGEIWEKHLCRLDQALQHYQAAFKTDSGHTDSIEAGRRVYETVGHWDGIASLFQVELGFCTQARRKAELLVELGTLQWKKLRNLEAAARFFNEASHLKPGDESIQEALGELHASPEWPNPEGLGKAAATFVKIAQRRESQGDREGAISYLRRALGADPSNEAAYIRLERTYQDTGRWEDLEVLYGQRVAVADPREQSALQMQRADLLERRLGNHQKARECFEAALEYEGPVGEVAERLMEIYRADGDNESLAYLLQEALRAPSE
ncbi:MAG: glycosyltransferase family 39 protein, partial [Planctomycetota bacterium]|nr:glycosyltransferase family 39 protein [Planctomycetota bacterium]